MKSLYKNPIFRLKNNGLVIKKIMSKVAGNKTGMPYFFDIKTFRRRYFSPKFKNNDQHFGN